MPHCHGHNRCGCGNYGGHRGHCHAGGCESWHDGPHPYAHEPDYLSDEEPTKALKDLQKLVSTLSKKITALEKKEKTNTEEVGGTMNTPVQDC